MKPWCLFDKQNIHRPVSYIRSPDPRGSQTHLSAKSVIFGVFVPSGKVVGGHGITDKRHT